MLGVRCSLLDVSEFFHPHSAFCTFDLGQGKSIRDCAVEKYPAQYLSSKTKGGADLKYAAT